MALMHGGQLETVAAQYNFPLSEWLDLSTGISPISYPIPHIPEQLWQQLPQHSDALIAAAKRYYNCPSSQNVLVTNGSQSIIKALPSLWRETSPSSKCAYLPSRGYKEHQQAWQQAGFEIRFYQDELPELSALTEYCVLVVINPNNPTAHQFDTSRLAQYLTQIKSLKGLMVVDEAFMDIADNSVVPLIDDKHILVLRSFGKFFGLAGIRIGFLLSSEYWHSIFSEYLGPWQVNGPAQFIASQALHDKNWQVTHKRTLRELRAQQQQLMMEALTDNYVENLFATDLFITLFFKKPGVAKAIYQLLCQHAVYVRLADEEDALRFGIAAPEAQQKLFDVLNSVRKILDSR